MKLYPLPDGARGVDTTLRFTPARAKLIKDAGFDFIMRYIEALTVAERDAILGQGLALGAVGYSRRPGWVPSIALGEQDARHHIEHVTAAGLMRGMTLYCDLEGPGAQTTGKLCIGYVNAWAHIIQSEGYIAGLYCGYGVPLSPDQMYYSLAVTGYWHGGGGRAVAIRGYQITQHAPSIYVSGLLVDTNNVTADGLGDTPVLIVEDK